MKEYRRFLELKIDKKDWASKRLSPPMVPDYYTDTKLVDEVSDLGVRCACLRAAWVKYIGLLPPASKLLSPHMVPNYYTDTDTKLVDYVCDLGVRCACLRAVWVEYIDLEPRSSNLLSIPTVPGYSAFRWCPATTRTPIW